MPRARTRAEAQFLAIGDGARLWLAEAAAAGATRVRAKMTGAVQLAALHGTQVVDRALGEAAAAGRFADRDLATLRSGRQATAADGVLSPATEQATLAGHQRLGPPDWSGGCTMSLRSPHEQALLDGEEIALVRRPLADCAAVLEFAQHNASPQVAWLLREATWACTERKLSPDGLAYYINLAIGHLDFAPAARSRR